MDHDFTKAKVVPSVRLICQIPESAESSFYRGQVFVHPKDGIFYPSSALRHAWELIDVVNQKYGEITPSVLAVYSDGGPDHNPTHASVQLALITVFVKLNKHMELRESFSDCMQPVLSLICERVSRMRLKEEPIVSRIATASDSDLLELFSVLHAICPSLKPDKESSGSTGRLECLSQ